MQLFTQEIDAKLKRNFDQCEANQGESNGEFPVVKVFNPYGQQTWLFSQFDEENDMLFGLCDLGQGFPELGWQSRQELIECRVNVFGSPMPLERDLYWTPKKSLADYAKEARAHQRICA